ncbi:MAG: hypothetical protein J6A28_01700 [Clostridia bacterium]|nr:hypothetical protein [Clostridia bacterium]
MNVFKGLDGIEFKVLNNSYNQKIKRFYGDKFDDYKNDILFDVYIDLLEYIKQNNHITKDNLFLELSKIADNKIMQCLYKIKQNDLLMSFDTSISKNGDRELFLYDVLEDKSNNFDILCESLVLKSFNELINNYDFDNKKILMCYFFKKQKVKDICNIHKIARKDFVLLVRGFRADFLDLLNCNGFFYKNVYYNGDEFETSNCHRLWLEREKAKKQGKTLYNFQDFKIYQLMRENGNIEDYANCLNITKDELEKYVYHKTIAQSKLFLYQIQALRDKFFKNYTLQELICE